MRRSPNADTEDKLIDSVAEYALDPLGYVTELAFDWGEGDLGGKAGPRKWQGEVFDEIGKHFRNKKTRHQPCQMAVASGHGIGKSAFIGMLINWGLSTCVDTKIVYTANTLAQLRTKTSPEITKWHNRSITSHWFKPTATAIAAIDKEHSSNWRADAVTWSENNTEAFAGLHNEGKRIIVIFDEASGIADKVWEVTEGALTDENTEIIWIAFGNPTQATGRFRECFRNNKKFWKTWQIDSRKVEGTNKVQIDKWIEHYGLDSDFVKIRVRGLFPNISAKQFIPESYIDPAYGKHLRPEQYNFAPKIITVDPAWEGDDELVISMRQGLAFKILEVIPKNDNDMLVGSKVAVWEDQEQADGVIIDLGYGTGILSYGRSMKRKWYGVWFSGESPEEGYLNLRAYMWGMGKKWLAEGGALPEDPLLKDELSAPETVPRVDGKIQLESKADMKGRGIRSPNRADSLMLSFAVNISKKAQGRSAPGGSHKHESKWKPLARRSA